MQDSSEALLRQCWEERLKGLPPDATSHITHRSNFLSFLPFPRWGNRRGR